MLAPTMRAANVGQGGGFCGGRRLQVVVGEFGGAVDGDGAVVGLDEVPQGPRAGRKGMRHAGNPCKASLAMRGDEGTVAGEGFNASPFVGTFRKIPNGVR